MNVTNSTDDSNNTDDENINCDIDIIIPALLFTRPCGLSFLCLISIMVYTLIKPLINKQIKNIHTSIRIVYRIVFYKWRRLFIRLIELGV